MTNDLSQLDVFFGDLTVNRAYVYARLPRPADDAGLMLTGQIRGPRCLYAETLPVTSPLVDLGPGPTLLARALVPEPCFWSPDLPAIYDVVVHLQRGSEIIATARREIGLRSLGVRGRHLALDGKRWVLRAVSTYATSADMPRRWHDAQAAYMSDDSNAQALAEASQWGALAVVFVRDNRDDQTAVRIRELTRYPGVAIVATDGQLPANFKRPSVAPNLLLAQWIGPDHWARLQPWADIVLVAADEPALLSETAAQAEIPIVAARFLIDGLLDIASARAECDRLQRDLAPIGQFAGYIV
jgi:hypothetical protein